MTTSSSTIVEVFAPAKVNLCLHVVGQRSDGYHLLDSLVGFAGIGDVLTLRAARRFEFTSDGPFAHQLPCDDSNIVMQVARRFCPVGALAIHLEKNLPVASGIGGGSADAAACYRGIASLLSRPHDHAILSPEDAAALLDIGADVPMCVASLPTRVRGIGEKLAPMAYLPELPVVLVNPCVGVSTPTVFQALACKENSGLAPLPDGPPDQGSFLRWLAGQRNDLEEVATSLVPEIGRVLSELRQVSACRLARMSGSGATCFALFQSMDAARQAAAELKQKHPGWWVAATQFDGSSRAAPQVIRATT